MNDPTSFHPDLTADRLYSLAQVIVQARRGALLFHDPASGEGNMSLGTRTRERACQAYKVLSREVDWLTYVVRGYYFLLLVGPSKVPIKFHRADPTDPPDRALRAIDTEVALSQAAFGFMENMPRQMHITSEPEEATYLRLLFQDDRETHDVFGVTLVRVSESGTEQMWEIDLTRQPLPTTIQPAAHLPEPADLDRPEVAPLAAPAKPKTSDDR